MSALLTQVTTDSFALGHKTVSRKHVVLSVAAVEPGEGVGKVPSKVTANTSDTGQGCTQLKIRHLTLR